MLEYATQYKFIVVNDQITTFYFIR